MKPAQTVAHEWRDLALTLADEARALFAPHLHATPSREVKADRSFVTALDRAIEERLRERIEARCSTHGIHGEEFGAVRTDAEFVWVLDPVDGTAPFLAGVPVFGCLIALLHHGVPVLGVMDFPATAERWLGVAGEPTTHFSAIGARVCRTRPCADLSQAILSASNPDFFSRDEAPALEALRGRTQWRIYGGCCLAYGQLASGRTDVALDARLALHDWAPFVPVIEGAGGVITDWQGRPLGLHNASSRILAAGDALRHAEALAIVQAAMAAPTPPAAVLTSGV